MPLVDLPPELDWPQHFSSWTRIEPRCRADDFTGGIEARTADPLWMLARQWQTGELKGEDAGSPIEVTLGYQTQTPDRVRLGADGAVVDLVDAPNEVHRPLETLVEQELCSLSWRDRVQIGQQFEQIALMRLGSGASALIQAVRLQFPLALPSRAEWVALDRATRRFVRLAVGRTIDGRALLDALSAEAVELPVGFAMDDFETIKHRFRQWCKRMNFVRDASRLSAWRNQQLDYRFTVNPAPVGGDERAEKTCLVAPDYRNGALEWYSFNLVKRAGEWVDQPPIKSLPSPISFTGTSPRWWAFEDAATNFGNLEVAKPDLAKLLLMEFTLLFGDDWFSVPLPVTMPNLVKVTKLQVRNVFGHVETIERARISNPDDPSDPLGRFELFTLSPVAGEDQPGICDSSAPGCGEMLWLPPGAGYREESPPVEEVRFMRDEGANMVWGVEHLVQNALGRGVSGFDAQRERIERREEEEAFQLERRLEAIAKALEQTSTIDNLREQLEAEREAVERRLLRLREGPPPPSQGMPRFRLATTVPENWIPFAPMSAGVDNNVPIIRLRRAQMLRNVDDEEPAPIPAMSRLLDLEDDPLLWLEEATVPRAGVRVQLTGQRVRWVDGKTYVWMGRKVTAGRGEGSSGLRFDVEYQRRGS